MLVPRLFAGEFAIATRAREAVYGIIVLIRSAFVTKEAITISAVGVTCRFLVSLE
jgi:hypothetical protein